MEKYLGKITNASFGSGGYQGAMFGASFTFEFDDGCGIGDFWGTWGPSIDCESDSCKWDESDRDKNYAEVMRRIANLMHEAKVDEFSRLVGVPVEITMTEPFGKMESWRVLTEVL